MSRNSSVPNLSQIKSDYVREAYQQIRSVNPSQRGNSSYRSSSYDYSNSGPSYYSSRSSRNNSSFSNRGGSRSYGASQGGSYSAPSRGGSSSGSRGSAGGGSRGGGKIN